jgi:hypothetical protein
MQHDLFGALVPIPARSNGCALHTLDATTLAFETPFSRELVDALKRAIPYHARRWDKTRSAWLIDATYGLVSLVGTDIFRDLEPF